MTSEVYSSEELKMLKLGAERVLSWADRVHTVKPYVARALRLTVENEKSSRAMFPGRRLLGVKAAAEVLLASKLIMSSAYADMYVMGDLLQLAEWFKEALILRAYLAASHEWDVTVRELTTGPGAWDSVIIVQHYTSERIKVGP